MLRPKFILITKVDEQVDDEVKFRSLFAETVRKRRVDRSISPQLRAPLQGLQYITSVLISVM